MCTLAKSATAEGIELPSLSGRVSESKRNLIAELSASACTSLHCEGMTSDARYNNKSNNPSMETITYKMT